MNHRLIVNGPACFAGENGCLNSAILYENSTILDDHHSSPIRREPGYLVKPCKNTGLSAEFDMPGKFGSSETGVRWSKRSGVFGLVTFPEFFENLKSRLFSRELIQPLLPEFFENPESHLFGRDCNREQATPASPLFLRYYRPCQPRREPCTAG